MKKKNLNAFTGAKAPRRSNANWAQTPICSIFQYYLFLFEEDSATLAERERRCRAGEMLCGECKKDIAEKLNKFLEAHREKREKAKDTIEQYHVKR